jgi:hypothetical protein
MAYAGLSQPYFFASVAVKDTEGLEPITADLEMVRGIPFEGKVLDGETGKPALGHISYYPLHPNPNVTNNLGGGAAQAVGPYSEAGISADGSFRCIVLPGPGFIGIGARDKKRYMSACVDPSAIKAIGLDKDILTIPFRVGFAVGLPSEQFQGILLLDPAKDCRSMSKTIRLKVAPELRGRVLDADGKPLSGVRVRGLEGSSGWNTLTTEEFRVHGVNPLRPRRLYFVHAARRLIGSLEVKGTETKPLNVQLQPWAAVRGRLVDAEGRPLRNAKLHGGEFAGEDGRTDAEGRFRLEGLIPGVRYNLYFEKDKPSLSGTLLEGFTGKAGEVRDVGDVQGKPFPRE